jgi:hypothetical protein
LRRSEEAVAQRDYRQALNAALDSREQAENAARVGADQKAIARSQAERELRDAQAALDQVTARVKAVESARPRNRRRRPVAVDRQATQTVQAAQAAVQKARTAFGRQDYVAARAALNGVAAQLQTAIRRIEQPNQASPTRRRR